MSGLPYLISDKIHYDDPKTLEEAIRRTKCIYDQERGRPTFQRAWEDRKKSMMDQRKKGIKPPFFRNNSQGKTTFKEPRMIETIEKRSRKPPIQCCGSGGDHALRDFPHRGEKVKAS
jgi:hypothetical protein